MAEYNKSVPYEPFESYSKRFEDFFTMKKENGIIEVRMHKDGGPAAWSRAHHSGWGKVFKAVGQDPTNEVLIFGGTGDKWVGQADPEAAMEALKMMTEQPLAFRREGYDMQYLEGSDLIYPLLYDIHIPTIGVVNGPGAGHTEFPLIADLTLAAPDATFHEPHFASLSMVTGDGLFLVFQELFGKRANKMAYTGQSVSAQEAFDCGAVAEIVERDKIYDRAWAIAKKLMKKDRYARRLQHEIMNFRWKRVFLNEFSNQFMAEGWAQGLADFGAKETKTGWSNLSNEELLKK